MLAALKAHGVGKLGDRQKIAGAISKAVRAGRELVEDASDGAQKLVEATEKLETLAVDVSDGERMRAGQFGQGLSSRFLVRSDSLTRTLSGADIIECAGRRYAVSGVKESGEREDGIEITTSTAGKPA